MSPIRAKLIWNAFLVGIVAVIVSWCGASYTAYTTIPEYNTAISLAVVLMLPVYLYVVYAVTTDTRYEPAQKRTAVWMMLAFGTGCGLVMIYVLLTNDFTALSDGVVEVYESSDSINACNEPTEPNSDAVCH